MGAHRRILPSLRRGIGVDRYKTMQTFVQVAKYSSLTAAARSLGISRALVSRQLTDLEHRLRVRLFNRSTRLVSLTEAGRRHFEFCDRLLAEMAEENMSLLGHNEAQLDGAIGVAAPEFVGDLDIGDALTVFSSKYPKVKIELVLGELLKEHGATETTFDIILQTKPSHDLPHARRIAQLRYVTCGSPDYLSRMGTPRSPADLATHSCLVHADDTIWRYAQAGRVKRVAVTPIFTSNSFEVLAKAAIQGLGLAHLPHRLVRPDLEQGALIPVLRTWRLPARSLYAVFPRGGTPPRRMRLLLDFLSEWFRSG